MLFTWGEIKCGGKEWGTFLPHEVTANDVESCLQDVHVRFGEFASLSRVFCLEKLAVTSDRQFFCIHVVLIESPNQSNMLPHVVHGLVRRLHSGSFRPCTPKFVVQGMIKRHHNITTEYFAILYCIQKPRHCFLTLLT